jgi:cellulose synthase/poly-beta-1,6-N-acetylglucosamine synthase-like glycosyltransferase
MGLAIVLAIFVFHRLLLGLLARVLPATKKPILPQDSDLPTVTIQLPVYNEPAVVARLLTAVAAIEYPREKLHIQILDDSTDCTCDVIDACLIELATRESGRRFNLIRRGSRVGFKAGALEHGFKESNAELIAILDADFVPPKNFLLELVGYFSDPRIGLVQARWGFLNWNRSIATRAQAALLSVHFQMEQAARSKLGLFMNFNGTAGIWRREAIIDAGGWQSDTLTEDLDLSIRAQMRGWRFVYDDSVVVPSELPEDYAAFSSQQRRWTVGAAQVLRKIGASLVSAPVSPIVRCDALLHLLQNATYLVLVATLILISATLLAGLASTSTFQVIFPHMVGVGAFAYMVLLSVTPMSHLRGWRARLSSVVMAWIFGAGMTVHNGLSFLEGLFGTQLEFVRTPKKGDGCSSPTQRVSKRSSLVVGADIVESSLLLLLWWAVVAGATGGEWSGAIWSGVFGTAFASLFVWKARGLSESAD